MTRELGLLMVLLTCTSAANAQDVQQRLATAKQAAADNQKALRAYSWLEKTELSLKGEVKATKVDACRYGADGRAQETPIVTPPPQETKRGLRGKVVAKKTGEMKEELESSAHLIQQYVPPQPDLMQLVINAGTASIAQAGPGAATLTFPGYVKAGDALKLTFDTAVKSLRQIDVATWLNKPDHTVNLRVTMESLPDGTSHPGVVTLTIPNDHIEVRVTKSNYQRVVQ